MKKDQETTAAHTETLRREARSRLNEEAPEVVRLLTRARRQLASQSRGLSEQIEALVQHLAHVRTKVDRLQAARGEDLRALERELDEGWDRLERCATRVRSALEEGDDGRV